jgi:hypothetical protein
MGVPHFKCRPCTQAQTDRQTDRQKCQPCTRAQKCPPEQGWRQRQPGEQTKTRKADGRLDGRTKNNDGQADEHAGARPGTPRPGRRRTDGQTDRAITHLDLDILPVAAELGGGVRRRVGRLVVPSAPRRPAPVKSVLPDAVALRRRPRKNDGLHVAYVGVVPGKDKQKSRQKFEISKKHGI